jgi:hypothetical protein
MRMKDGTLPVRISAKRYNTLRKDAKKNGHSILWLLNYIIDLYYQENGVDSLTGKPLTQQSAASQLAPVGR